MSKISIKNVLFGYIATLRDARSGRVYVPDILVQIVFPTVVSIAYGVLRGLGIAPVGNGGVSTNIITIVSIVAALLCGAAVMVFQLRFDMIGTDIQGFARKDELVLIDEIYAGMLWAITEGFIVAGVLTLRGVVSMPVLDIVLVSIALCLFANFCLVLLMCLKRMSRAYEFVSKYWSKAKAG